MTSSYLDYKSASFLSLLQSSEWEPKSSHQVRLLAKILGNIHHLAQILPFGNHISIHLQLCLSRFIHTHIRRVKYFSSMNLILRAAWNPRSSVRISYSAARDLLHLPQLLKSSTKLMWYCPISLLIPRCPHFVGQSYAYNIAMGGLCLPLLIQWRLSNSVFRCLPEWQSSSPDKPSVHINIRDLIALVNNAFFIMMSFTDLHCQGSPILTDIDRWIFLLEADNMSTLSWMSILSLMQ